VCKGPGKRQKGLVGNGSVDIMGHKLKPPEDGTGKGWCVSWSEEAAPVAWEAGDYTRPLLA